MNEDRFLTLANSELSKSLFYFKDSMGDEPESIMRHLCKTGYSHTLTTDIEYLKYFVEHTSDLIWIRDFVEYEMNISFDDPTGQAHLEWLADALNRMQKVLAEYEPAQLNKL